MRNSFVAVFFLILFSISCSKEQNQSPDIRNLLSKSVIDPVFKMRFGIDSNASEKYYILTSDSFTDSLVVEGNTYFINPKSRDINLKKLLVLHLDSVNLKERKLTITHIYPSLETEIRGEFTFTLERNHWDLKERKITIADGHFKLISAGFLF
jgi:hypothetical protein